MIAEACHAGARLASACAVVGIAARTLQRWRDEAGLREDARAAAAQERIPANRLSDAEREAMLSLVNQPAFAHWPPSQIVPALADQGRYLASASSFYRVLRAADQVKVAAGKRRAPRHQRPAPLTCHRRPIRSGAGTSPIWRRTVRGVLLSVPDHGCLQPQDRRLGGLRERIRRAGGQRLARKAYLREGVAGWIALVLHSPTTAHP
jgi:putative transposase